MYVPPDVGYTAASWADAVALQYAIAAAMANPINSPAPAARAAGPNAANTPAPIIDPRPITTASTVPSRRDSSGIPRPLYQCVKIRLFSNTAPMTLTPSHSRCDRGGSSAGAAVSQTVHGSQIRSVSALLSMLTSAQTMATSIARSSRCRPDRRRIAAGSNTRPSPATLPKPIAHTTDARLPQLQYWNGRS